MDHADRLPVPSKAPATTQETRGFLSASAPAASNAYLPPQSQPQLQTQARSEEEMQQQQLPLLAAADDTAIDIATHPVDNLLEMLAALLQKIVDANDQLHGQTQPQDQPPQQREPAQLDGSMLHRRQANVVAFHGRNVPAISLHAYLGRILKYCPVSNDVFLSLLVYFDRIAKRANKQQHQQSQQQHPPPADDIFVMDSYNIHRLIIAGITVASKFFSDVFYKNSRYAKVGGLPLDELNHLELQMLLLLDFELLIPSDELQRYAQLLVKFWHRENSTAMTTTETTSTTTTTATTATSNSTFDNNNNNYNNNLAAGL